MNSRNNLFCYVDANANADVAGDTNDADAAAAYLLNLDIDETSSLMLYNVIKSTDNSVTTQKIVDTTANLSCNSKTFNSRSNHRSQYFKRKLLWKIIKPILIILGIITLAVIIIVILIQFV